MGELEKGVAAFNAMSVAFSGFKAGTNDLTAVGAALSGLSAESQIAALSTLRLSEAEALVALEAAGVTGAEAQSAAAIIASGAAAEGAATGFKALGVSMMNAAKGLAAFLFTNPLGQMMLIAAGVFALTKAYDAIVPTFDKAKKAAENSRNEYQDTTSKLQSLNNELKTTKERINELETKKTLSLTEEAELTKLKAQNKELETQIGIKEKLADVQEKTAAYNAKQELTIKDEKFALDTLDNGGLIDADVGGSYSQASKMYTDIVTYTKKKQEELNGLLDQEKELTKEQARLANSGQIDSSQFKKNEKELESLQKQIGDHTAIISENTEEIQTNYQSLFDSSGNLISGNEQAAASCEELFQLIQDGTSAAQEAEGNINTIFSEEKFAGVKDQLVEAAKAGTLDTAIKGVDGLSAEMDKLGISADDFKQSIQAIADQDLSNVEKQMEILNEEFQKGGVNEEDIAGRSSMMSKFFKGKNEEDISNFYDYVKNQGIDISQWSAKDLEYNWKISLDGVNEATAQLELLQTSLKNAQNDLANLNTAMTESNSATGLTAESVQNLRAMYADYDVSDLFENTATGVKLNTSAVRELNEQYAEDQAKTYTEKLTRLNEKLVEEKEKLKKLDSTEDSEGYVAQLDNIENLEYQISEVENLASVWKGATSAYNEYIQAQSAGNERDSLQGIAKDKEAIENAISQGWGDSENVQSYLDLMLGEDRPQKASAAWQQLSDTIGETGHSLSDYMSLDDDGNIQADNIKMWFEDIAEVAGEGFTEIADDGTRTLDLTGDNVERLAEKFHTSAEFITLLAQALDDASNTDVEWNIGSDQVQNEVAKVTASVDEAKAKLSELQESGSISDSINLDFNANTASLGDFESQLKSLRSIKIDAEVDPSGAAALDTLINKTEQEYYLKINADTGGQLDTAIEKVNEIKDRIEQAKSEAGDSFDLKATVDGDDKIKEAAKTLSELPPEVTTAVGIRVQDGGAEGILNQLKDAPDSINVPVNYEMGNVPEEPKYEDQNPKIDYSIDAPPEPKYKNQTPKITYSMSAPPEPSYSNIDRNITYHIHTVGSAPSGGGPVDGTARPGGSAFAKGTAKGRAFKSGYWGTRSSGLAIGGELGEEILVRDGHFYTIGSDSAELFKYKKGDIIE